MRNCYAAALSAGAYPSGAPGYRNPDGSVFSAAVEDLDGNVIEFVFRDGLGSNENEGTAAPSESHRVIAWQKDVADSGLHDDMESVSSQKTGSKSRMQTVMDLASSASGSAKDPSEESKPGISRAATMPTSSGSGFPTKALFGTVLGAAAGAALMFAVTRSEKENAREERDFESFKASTKAESSRGKPATVQTVFDPRDAKGQQPHQPHRNFSATESISRPPKSHRNFSVTESAYSKPQLPQPPPAMRAIDQAAFYDDDSVREAISRFTARRPGAPKRSKTTDVVEYAPASRASRSQAPRSSASYATSNRHLHSGKSRHYDKRSAVGMLPPNEQGSATATLPANEERLMLEAPPAKSTASYQSSRRSRRDDAEEDEQDLKRRDSGISFGSLHSKHGDERSRVSRRTESTIKASRAGTSHHGSAADIPLPDSRATSDFRSRYTEADDHRSKASRRSESTVRPSGKASSRHESAADVPLPESKAPSDFRSRYTERDDNRSHASKRSESTMRASRKPSSHHDSAADVALPESRAASDYRSRYTERDDTRSHASRRSESTMRASRKASSHHDSAAGVPLPESKAPSDYRSRHTAQEPDDRRSHASRRSESTVRASRKGSSHHDSAAGVPLPASKAPSHVTEGHRSRHTDAGDRGSHPGSRRAESKAPTQRSSSRAPRDLEVEVTTYPGSKAAS